MANIARSRPAAKPGAGLPSRPAPGKGRLKRKGRSGSRRDAVGREGSGRRYAAGYETGYRDGVQAGIGSFADRFDGVSIVIPSFNQAEMTRQCIESIRRYTTDLSYEIIVVDNASTDGTDRVLRSFGRNIRAKTLPDNRGFAGAVNVGMMMAKGSEILLLNNDTLATDRWLVNMLQCLRSSERIGMVGPITNYIGGSQQVPVPYADVGDMPAFARGNNVPDANRWRRTDQLTGFCLLFRRSLFERIGYFDEGFQIGNYEDNDYNLRVRLLGLELVVAEDSFIHHFGSVSMKTLGDRLAEVNDRNSRRFLDKWPGVYDWLDSLLCRPEWANNGLASAAVLYPERVAVRGIGPTAWWIEGGIRREVAGEWHLPVVRVSLVDLRRWEAGPPIGAEEAEAKWRGADTAFGAGLVRTGDGALYHAEGGNRLRGIYCESALNAWELRGKPVADLSPEAAAQASFGLPIICPPEIRQAL